MQILTGLAFQSDVVTTGQTAQSMCFATSLSTAKKILDTGLIPVELFTNSSEQLVLPKVGTAEITADLTLTHWMFRNRWH